MADDKNKPSSPPAPVQQAQPPSGGGAGAGGAERPERPMPEMQTYVRLAIAKTHKPRPKTSRDGKKR
jgi:hypothetical protein